jgi:pantoate--beta-alanine ligase
VRESLRNNDNTVVSIFVNPAQFAPKEDLSTYPRTLEHDLELLSKESPQGALVVFLPSAEEMYPSGIVQDKEKQKGTFVEVKGYDQEMEGGKRPTFFRGVATVVLKLFNIIQVQFTGHSQDAH